MDMEEIKRRRMQGLYLCRQGEARAVCGDLLGLQAQVHSAALHALRIRTGSVCTDGLVKTWTIRGTMHLIPEKDLPLYRRLCGRAEDVVKTPWYLWQSSRGQALTEKREIFLAKMVLDGLHHGVEKREDLRLLLREGGMTDTEEESVFHSWGGMMAELAQAGLVGLRVSTEKAYCLLKPFVPMEEETAGREMLRRYLASYGPATLKDAAYFFHEPQKKIKQWMEGLPVETVQCGGRTYFCTGENAAVELPPACAFLAGFDPLMLGYRKEENPFLPQEHLRKVFSLTGMVAPTVLVAGRAVGKWKQEQKQVSVTLFENVGAKAQTLMEEEAHRLWPEKKLWICTE